MDRRFDGKVAVVTGGNSGIGLAAAKAFAAEGAQVAITGRSEATLKEVQRELGADSLAIRADVSRLDEIDMAMEQIRRKFGRIDALFVNAGIGKFVPLLEVTEKFFDETVATNLKGAFFTVQKATPLFADGAAVVLNASVNAHKGMPNSSVYGATKAAVVNLARTLSADLLPRVRVNAISPGPVETAIFQRMGLSDSQLSETKQWISSQVPLKRFAQPEEIAAAVLYLSSSESRFVVGTELVIDGGMIGL
ncbi:MAG TPA: glucose 1-dehydrogenase [Candidatus Polarisedimenticolaceae bacterium]|nr:glucose 1-dehydrogenase [Candidatus Polarisedimenticolaceae bacterium]